MLYIRAVVDCSLYCNKQYEYEVELKLTTLACTRIKLNSGTYNFLSRNFVYSNSFIWFCSFHFVSGDLTVIIINLHIYIYCLRCNEHPQETSRFAALQLQWAMMPTALSLFVPFISTYSTLKTTLKLCIHKIYTVKRSLQLYTSN